MIRTVSLSFCRIFIFGHFLARNEQSAFTSRDSGARIKFETKLLAKATEIRSACRTFFQKHADFVDLLKVAVLAGMHTFSEKYIADFLKLSLVSLLSNI